MNDNEKLNEFIDMFADGECVERSVIDNVIAIHRKCESFVEGEVIQAIKEHITVDTVNYMLARHAFDGSVHEPLDTASHLYNLIRREQHGTPSSEKQLEALSLIVKFHVKPFCDGVFDKLLRYWNEYRQFA